MDVRRVALAGLGAVALIIAALQLPVASSSGEAASREIATTATVVYVSLRAVNAALSVAQEIEVGASAVAQATTQPLKVLDPVDDTIERVAGIVFAVASISWVLSVAFQPLSVVGFFALGIGLILLSLGGRRPGVAAVSKTLVHLGLTFALILPLLYAGGTALGRTATASAEEQAQATLDGVASNARLLIGREEAASRDLLGSDVGWLGRMFGGMSETKKQIAGFANAADYYWTNADAVLEAAFVLIAIFALRMLILPGALLILTWRMLGRIL